MNTLMKKAYTACARNWLLVLALIAHLLVALLCGQAFLAYPLPAIVIGLANAIAGELSMRYARRRTLEREARRLQRNAEDLTPYMPITRAVGVLGLAPTAWTEANWRLVRAAFVQQHPHVVQGFQNAVALWSTANEVAFRCTHSATAADWEAWEWTVNRETGEFYNHAYPPQSQMRRGTNPA